MKSPVKGLVAITSMILLVAMAAMLLSSSNARASAMGDGAATFKAKCVACHGADGSGATAMGKKLGIRSLGSPEVQSQSDAKLFAVIAKGKGKMPSYEKSLGADQINDLVAYIRQLGRR